MPLPFHRLGFIALVALSVSCIESSADEAGGLADPGDGGGGSAPPAECVADTDCAPAASSCCECPSFALSVDSRFDDSCEDVNCESPPAGSCPDTRAVCSRGECVLECRPIQAAECAQTCATGYMADAFGCLTCECQLGADPGQAECSVNDDCAKVPSDCCGCARGGADTAVPVSQVTDFSGELGCDGSAVCPDVDVCEADQIAMCIGGTCRLQSTDTPPDAGPGATPTGDTLCGTSSLPPCPAQQTCVLNDPAAKDATAAGVGVCRGE